MAKPGPPPESLLAALPPELSRGLFAEAPKISLATDQTLFFAGDEGDGCYRLDEGMLICKDRSSTGLSTDSRASVSCLGLR